VQQQPAEQQRADRVQPVGEGGHHPKVAAPAAQRPQQLGLLLLVDGEHSPVGGHQLGGEQVVAGQAEATRQPALAAAEGEPGDPGAADPPAGDGGQAVPLGGGVQLTPDHAALGGRGAGGRVDRHPALAGQVDDQVPGDGLAGDAVPAAADRHRQVVVACHLQRRDDVAGAGDPGDGAGPVVDSRVVQPPRRL
jgi:hypothetical protein